MTITQEAVDALVKLKEGLNAAEDANLLTGDDACDMFSDTLFKIGKDYEWWCELEERCNRYPGRKPLQNRVKQDNN